MAVRLAPTATFVAQRAMAATTDHVATGVAVRTMLGGGSAADAAVAAGAVLAVIAPYACGLGGDVFALVHEPGTGAPRALVAAGRAGSGADARAMRAEGLSAMPMVGDIRSATAPGAVDGLLTLHATYGRMPLAEVLAPAIALAGLGFSVSPVLAIALAQLDRTLPGGRAAWIPGALGRVDAVAGLPIRRPGHARTLAAIAEGGRDAFYRGEFARGLVDLSAGLFSESDLAESHASWQPAIGTDVWGHTLWSAPAPSQGYLIPLTAAIAARLALPDDPDNPEWAHSVIEATIAAGHDRPELLHDGADTAAQLSPSSIATRTATVGDDHARSVRSMPGDTTQICTVDEDRLSVSLIQSNAANFGTMLFEPATGVELHNRGVGFSLVEGAVAELAAGARPPHTLSPAMITNGSDVRAVLGAAGGDAQPHVVVQLAARLLQAGQSAGESVGAARFRLGNPHGSGFDTWTSPAGRSVLLEEGAPEAWIDGLRGRGHDVHVRTAGDAYAGHGHIIDVTPHGLAGAAEPRALTGAVAGW